MQDQRHIDERDLQHETRRAQASVTPGGMAARSPERGCLRGQMHDEVAGQGHHTGPDLHLVARRHSSATSPEEHVELLATLASRGQPDEPDVRGDASAQGTWYPDYGEREESR
jgi:hypothetical protein